MDKIEVGKRIKYFRELKELSQNGLANKAGISPTYIYQLEKGEKSPTVESIYNICRFGLGITLEEFFREPQTSVQTEDCLSSLTDIQKKRLNDFLTSLK